MEDESSKGAGQRLQVWSVSEAEWEAKMKEELEDRQAERRREKTEGSRREYCLCTGTQFKPVDSKQ